MKCRRVEGLVILPLLLSWTYSVLYGLTVHLPIGRHLQKAFKHTPLYENKKMRDKYSNGDYYVLKWNKHIF